MTRSIAEMAALAARAATGAGFPPAQAQHFGRAAVRHLADGGAPEPLLAALADPGDSPILRLPLLVEDILRALQITGTDLALTLQPGDDRLACAYARTLALDISECRVEHRETGARLHVVADRDSPDRPALPERLTPPPSLVEALEALAARTYVPESARSRETGAGAGDD